MKIIYTILGVITILLLTVIIFILIEYIVGRLPEDHRFVKWWRRHVVGVIDSDDELF